MSSKLFPWQIDGNVFLEYEDTTLSVVSKDPIFCDAFSTYLIAMPKVERNAFIKNKKIEIFISGN